LVLVLPLILGFRSAPKGMASQKILLIAYWFPPAGGIAVQRALSLARYLPQYDCQVHVLTPRNPPSPVRDPALLERVPLEVVIHRAWMPMPTARFRKRVWGWISRRRNPRSQSAQVSRSGRSLLSRLVQRLLCPDPEVVWVPFATWRARRIIQEHGIDTVMVTAPPFSAFLIGNALKREFPSLRLISDFRDEWLRFFLSTFEFQKSGHMRGRAEAIERATIEASDVVVTVTPSLVEELRQRYPDHPASKFVCVPNGYDPAAFADFRPRKHQGDKVLVTHVGTAYKTASPRCYFEALDALPEELRGRIETRFIGRIAEGERELLESRRDVQLLGYVPQTEALRCMEETDYLLLVLLDPIHVSGKIYEYLATGKPVLAFSPVGGEVARTLAETGGGWCLDPEDGDAIRSCLRAVASGDLAACFRPNREAVLRYERPRLAGEFAAAMRGTGPASPTLAAGSAAAD
jgi:glycosyltransferase involved in cell wall biosynthesis